MAGYLDIVIDPHTNDIGYEDGKVKFCTGEDETIQRVRTCLRRIEGEWFLDTNAGLPYFGGQMLGGKDLEYVKLLIREELLLIEGVNKITEINILMDKATKATSVYVEIELNQNVYKITEEI